VQIKIFWSLGPDIGKSVRSILKFSSDSFFSSQNYPKSTPISVILEFFILDPLSHPSPRGAWSKFLTINIILGPQKLIVKNPQPLGLNNSSKQLLTLLLYSHTPVEHRQIKTIDPFNKPNQTFKAHFDYIKTGLIAIRN
jgi:hypothetical protein